MMDNYILSHLKIFTYALVSAKKSQTPNITTENISDTSVSVAANVEHQRKCKIECKTERP